MLKTILAAVVLTTGVTGYECKPYGEMQIYLSETKKERVAERGWALAGGVIEVWKNDFTWTIIVIDTRKRSCIVAIGEGWRSYRSNRPKV